MHLHLVLSLVMCCALMSGPLAAVGAIGQFLCCPPLQVFQVKRYQVVVTLIVFILARLLVVFVFRVVEYYAALQ